MMEELPKPELEEEPKTGLEELIERQAAIREAWMARCVIECDIGD